MRRDERRGLALFGAGVVALLALHIAGWVWQRVSSARLAELTAAAERGGGLDRLTVLDRVEHIVSLMSWGGAAQTLFLAIAAALAALGLWRLGGRGAAVAAAALWLMVAALLVELFVLALGSAAAAPSSFDLIGRLGRGAEQLARAVAVTAGLAALHGCSRQLARPLSLVAGALAWLHAVLPVAMAIAPEATSALVLGPSGQLWLGASFATATGSYLLLLWQLRAARRSVGDGDDDEAAGPAALGHAPRWERVRAGLRLWAAAITMRVLASILGATLIALAVLARSVALLDFGLMTLPVVGALTAGAAALGALRAGAAPGPGDARRAARAAAALFAAVAAVELCGALTFSGVLRDDWATDDILMAAGITLETAALLGYLLAAATGGRLGELLGDADLARRGHRLLAPVALIFSATALIRVAIFARTDYATPTTPLFGFAVLATASMAAAIALARLLRHCATAIDERLDGGAVPEARATITEPSE